MITKKKLFKAIEDLDLRIDSLLKRYEVTVERLADFEDSLVECDRCGCLLKEETAIRGKAEVRERDIFRFGVPQLGAKGKEEYFHIPYYCKVHVPRSK